MNAASLFSAFVSTHGAYISKLARKMENSILTYEDCVQELNVKVIEVLEKDKSYFTVSQNDAFNSLRRVLSNFSLDKIRYAITHNDTIYKTSLESTSISADCDDEDENSANTFDHFLQTNFESELDTELLVEDICSELEKYEEQFPGIVNYFLEIVSPSEEIAQKYEEYKSTQKRPRTNGLISPSVTAILMGYDQNYGWKIEAKLKTVLSSVFGISKNSVLA